MMLRFANAVTTLFKQESGRFWNIVVPPHIYTETLALLREIGDGGPSPRPVWVFAAPYQGPSGGWLLRAAEITREGGRTTASAADAADPAADAREVFARALADAAPAGLVVVLAPQHIDDARAYDADIEALATEPALASVRWVVVDAAHSSLARAETRAIEWTHVIEPAIDEADKDQLKHILSDLAASSARLSPELEARLPANSPLRAREAAPARRLLHEADKRSDAGLHEEAAELREDVRAQLEARGLRREAVHVAMLRARSLVAAGSPDEGQRVFVAALREAERLKMNEVVPEAYASLASLHASQQRFGEALEAYTRASQLAEGRGSRALAADFRRCAGHAALNANMPDTAIEAWTRAFALLEASAPVTASLKTPQRVIILGLALAEVFEERGNLAAASALRGHAEQIERRDPRPSGSFS